MSYYQKNDLLLSKILDSKSLLDEPCTQNKDCKEYVFLHDEKNILVKEDNRKLYIHSKYDIDNEKEEMLKSIDKNNCTTIIMFGIGYGHVLLCLLQELKVLKRIVIVEPSIEIFKESLKYLDYSLLDTGIVQLDLIIGDDTNDGTRTINDIFFKNRITTFDFIWNINYRTLFNEYYNQIEKALWKIAFTNHGEVNTVFSLATAWSINTIFNITKKSIPFNRVKEVFTNKNIIIVSAGPSLKKNIHLLKNVEQKAIVVAVGTSIRILDQFGIRPDFHLAVEAKDEEYDIFKDLKNNTDVPLIYSNSLNCNVLMNYKGALIEMLFLNDGIGYYTYLKTNTEYYKGRSGYSCANIASWLFVATKAKKIIFMGQDMAYTNGDGYCVGAPEKSLGIHRFEAIKTIDIYGKEVMTDKIFIGMKNDFELLVKSSKGVEYVNATEGGAGISGVIDKNFIEVLAELKNEKNENADINEYLSSMSSKKDISKIEYVLKQFENKYLEMISFCERIYEFLNKEKTLTKEDFFEGLIQIEKEYIDYYKDELFLMIIRNIDFGLKSISDSYEGRRQEGQIELFKKFIFAIVNLLYKSSNSTIKGFEFKRKLHI